MKIDISKFLKDKEDPATEQPNQYGYLKQLNLTNYNMYAGTVPESTVQKRRAKNKAARKARKVNRGIR